MQISIIVATAQGNAIGRKGDLLFHISADLRRFKEITMGHPIIMGRKTFESFPKGPLPGRQNIVITRQSDYAKEGITVTGSFSDALAAANDADEVFVIGGGEIYREAINRASKLYLTEIDATVDDADTFFPTIDSQQWQITEEGEWIEDERTGARYRFVCLSRR
jgi:dihydrofolate reductase